MELKRLDIEQLESLLHHLCEAEEILNIDEKRLNDMDAERDNALIHLNCMKISVFNEISIRKRNRRRVRKAAHKEIVAILMQRDGDTESEAWDRVHEVVDLLKQCFDIDDAYDIIADNLGLEPDCLTILLA
jgi:hypothetical protein